VVTAAEYFDEPVSLVVNRQSTRSQVGALTSSHLSFVSAPGGTTLFIASNPHVALQRGFQRRLTVPPGIDTLYIHNLPWLSSVECLQTMSDLTSLVLKDIPIRTLPSFSSLSNLNFLTLDQLHEMREMPLGICDAPKLEQLSVFQMINLVDFSVAFIRGLTTTKETLSHANDPLRLKMLYIDKCSAVVPNEINELLGLEKLHIADCAFDNPLEHPVPNIGLTLRLLTHLDIVGFYDLFVLPDDMSGLTSLLKLSMFRVAIKSIPPSIQDLHKLDSLFLNEVNIKTIPKEVGQLKNLVVLKLQNCPWLEDIEVNFCEKCPLLDKVMVVRCGVSLDVPTKIYWRLVEMTPWMRGMSMIHIKGAPFEEACAFVDGLMAFPPHSLKLVNLDEDCYNYWRDKIPDIQPNALPIYYGDITVHPHFSTMQELMMSDLFGGGNPNFVTPFDMNDVYGLMCCHSIAEERKLLTFALSLHPRLGFGSPVSVLDKYLVAMVLNFATGKTSFEDRFLKLSEG